jgi:alkanesulfonate monooxygenase SsuD/methylene tetrahydromethanopterin reductase-like flavin-dependent oxidoreductase (luciferase family)
LGTCVALPLEHDPIALAKTIASLDFLSGGRVRLGVGFGWNHEEMAHHGVNIKRRRTMMKDYLAAMQALWGMEVAEHDGEFVQFGPSWAWPKPLQQPRVPVVVGAFGNERLFEWVAESADGWMTTPLDTDLENLIRLLHLKWNEAGRSGEPEVVALDTTAGQRLQEFADLGVTEAIIGLPDAEPDEIYRYLDKMATLVERVQADTL